MKAGLEANRVVETSKSPRSEYNTAAECTGPPLQGNAPHAGRLRGRGSLSRPRRLVSTTRSLRLEPEEPVDRHLPSRDRVVVIGVGRRARDAAAGATD